MTLPTRALYRSIALESLGRSKHRLVTTSAARRKSASYGDLTWAEGTALTPQFRVKATLRSALVGGPFSHGSLRRDGPALPPRFLTL